MCKRFFNRLGWGRSKRVSEKEMKGRINELQRRQNILEYKLPKIFQDDIPSEKENKPNEYEY